MGATEPRREGGKDLMDAGPTDAKITVKTELEICRPVEISTPGEIKAMLDVQRLPKGLVTELSFPTEKQAGNETIVLTRDDTQPRTGRIVTRVSIGSSTTLLHADDNTWQDQAGMMITKHMSNMGKIEGDADVQGWDSILDKRLPTKEEVVETWAKRKISRNSCKTIQDEEVEQSVVVGEDTTLVGAAADTGPSVDHVAMNTPKKLLRAKSSANLDAGMSQSPAHDNASVITMSDGGG